MWISAQLKVQAEPLQVSGAPLCAARSSLVLQPTLSQRHLWHGISLDLLSPE